jgi:hypothetical protein
MTVLHHKMTVLQVLHHSKMQVPHHNKMQVPHHNKMQVLLALLALQVLKVDVASEAEVCLYDGQSFDCEHDHRDLLDLSDLYDLHDLYHHDPHDL